MGPRSPIFRFPGFYRVFWVQKPVKTKMQVTDGQCFLFLMHGPELF